MATALAAAAAVAESLLPISVVDLDSLLPGRSFTDGIIDAFFRCVAAVRVPGCCGAGASHMPSVGRGRTEKCLAWDADSQRSLPCTIVAASSL